MEFHEAAYRLLGSTPHNSPTAPSELREVEQRLGYLLPDAVREWYLAEHATETLAQHSNGGHWTAIRDFTVLPWGEQRLLPIGGDAQQVCTWAVLLDSSADPPVLEYAKDGPREWRTCAATFSAFIYAGVWDFCRVVQQPWFAQSYNARLSPSALRILQANCLPELITERWPARMQYRFAGAEFGLLIWSLERETEWFVGAGSEGAFRSALRFLWPLDAMGDVLQGRSAADREVIDELRKSFS